MSRSTADDRPGQAAGGREERAHPTWQAWIADRHNGAPVGEADRRDRVTHNPVLIGTEQFAAHRRIPAGLIRPAAIERICPAVLTVEVRGRAPAAPPDRHVREHLDLVTRSPNRRPGRRPMRKRAAQRTRRRQRHCRRGRRTARAEPARPARPTACDRTPATTGHLCARERARHPMLRAHVARQHRPAEARAGQANRSSGSLHRRAQGLQRPADALTHDRL
jgi:hypothetical protein